MEVELRATTWPLLAATIESASQVAKELTSPLRRRPWQGLDAETGEELGPVLSSLMGALVWILSQDQRGVTEGLGGGEM